MSNLTAGRGSSVSQYLRATQEIPQGVVFDAKYTPGPNMCVPEDRHLGIQDCGDL